MDRPTETSQQAKAQFKARLAVVFYLLSILTGMFAAFAGGRLAVYSDTANLIGGLCYVTVTLLLYDLFKPVSRSLSLLAALFSLVGCTLFILHFVHRYASPISPLVFFGFYCLLLGYLILRSTFMPRAVGALMVFAGLNWLTFLSPRLAERLSPFNMIPGLIGEGALTLSLLAFGARNAERWQQQASATGLSHP